MLSHVLRKLYIKCALVSLHGALFACEGASECKWPQVLYVVYLPGRDSYGGQGRLQSEKPRGPCT